MGKKGLLIVVSGPSGVGKGTILKEVMADPELNMAFSVSMTTREKRVGEEDGVNYFFVTREEFMRAKENGELLESAEFVGNCYGTPLNYVNRLRDEGKNVVLEIDVAGCIQVVEKVPEAVTVFIIPPSTNALLERLRTRGTESEEVIQARVAKADEELRKTNYYKYVICNDDLDVAIGMLKNVIRRNMEENV